MRREKKEAREGTDGKQESMKGKRGAAERSASGKAVEKKEKLREREEAFVQLAYTGKWAYYDQLRASSYLEQWFLVKNTN